MAKKTRSNIQFAALPCRRGNNGRPQVMLLTSRETCRWVIPKGWPMKGRQPDEVAAREAYEEAGLVGQVLGGQPLGTYHYEKGLRDRQLLCEVHVFLFWVERQLDDWPEKGQRETRWFEPEEAMALVDEGGLAELVRVTLGAVGAREPAA